MRTTVAGGEMTRRKSLMVLSLLLGTSLLASSGTALELDGDYRGSNVFLELPGLIGPMEVERSGSPEGPWTLIESRGIGCTQYCSYEDWEIEPGTVYYYRMWIPHETGEKDLYGPVRVVIPDLRSQGFSSFASPNPFHNRTSLRFDIPNLGTEAEVRVDLVDAQGRLVRTFREEARPGSHIIAWNGRSQSGETVRTGVYYYRISVPGYTESGRLLFLK
jgi:hypothetical protein